MRFGTPNAPFTPMFAAGVNARAKHNLKSSLNRWRLALFLCLFFWTNMELNRGSTCHQLDRRTLINEHPLVQTDLAARITHPPQHVTEVLAHFVPRRFVSLRAAALRLLCFYVSWHNAAAPAPSSPPRRARWRDRSVILTSRGERYRCIKWRGRKHQGRVLASSFVGVCLFLARTSGCRQQAQIDSTKGSTNHNA